MIAIWVCWKTHLAGSRLRPGYGPTPGLYIFSTPEHAIFIWYFEHKSYITTTYTSMKRFRLKAHFSTPILQFCRSLGSLIAPGYK
jgi:hypothetical protein